MKEGKNMAGEVGILNVGAGDTKISFDPANPAEVKRASAIVDDMLKRGFALLIEVGRDDKGPLYRRATGFDPETAEYIIAGTPEEFAPAQKEDSNGQQASQARARAGRTKARGPSTTRVAAASTNAVAVARTAGG